jgi:hypothetical protein
MRMPLAEAMALIGVPPDYCSIDKSRSARQAACAASSIRSGL